MVIIQNVYFIFKQKMIIIFNENFEMKIYFNKLKNKSEYQFIFVLNYVSSFKHSSV